MTFTNAEVEYIHSQRLARISTVSAAGQPDVTPVGFEFDVTHFWIGGYNPTATRRTRNIQAGNDKVALVIDDLAPGGGWRPRYLRVYGTCELVERPASSGTIVMKVMPTTSWSVNLDAEWSAGGTHRLAPRKTDHILPGQPSA
jgi:pyridoxamine 5'-phosphate oxidase family protein